MLDDDSLGSGCSLEVLLGELDSLLSGAGSISGGWDVDDDGSDEVEEDDDVGSVVVVVLSSSPAVPSLSLS